MKLKLSAIKWLYTYRFLDDFIFIYPLYQLMFVAHGLDLAQISWLFAIWSATTILIDVPTGVLADRFSRKNLLAIGQLIKALGFATWLAFPNFWGYAAGFVLWGIGGTFHSGTFEALIYDELKLLGLEKTYVKVKGRSESLSLIGNLVATTSAAALIILGYNWVLTLSIGAVLLAALVAYFIPEAPRQEEVGDSGYFADLRDGFVQAFHNQAILKVILLGSFIGAAFGSLEEYITIYFQEVGAPLPTIPLLDAFVVLFTVVGSLLAHRFELLSTRAFMFIMAAGGLSLVASAGLGGPGGIGLLALFFFIIKSLETIYDGKLQHNIKGKLRATVTSVGGFTNEIMSIGMFIGFGWVATTWGTFAAFGAFGAMTVAVALAYFLIGRRVFAAS